MRVLPRVRLARLGPGAGPYHGGVTAPDRDREIEATTRLLRRLKDGDGEAEQELLPRVYDELHRIAAGFMHQRSSDHTLQPTALVHEAYLRMTGGEEQNFADRRHFIAVAAKAMRSVLVDHARKKGARKRDPGGERSSLDGIAEAFEQTTPDLVALDSALNKFSKIDPNAARVVELRFFGGLEHAEVAQLTDASERSVQRQWRVARLWLQRELSTQSPQ